MLDPGDMPDHNIYKLPELTAIEEMLISVVHVNIEVRQYRGQQYRYQGHVCHFMRHDLGKMYEKLPLLPKELDIVILKPANHTTNAGLQRQFTKDYKVRRKCIRVWLEFLIRHHPGYKDVVIDNVSLSQLPENGDVEAQLSTQVLAAIDEDMTTEQIQAILDDRDDEDQEIAAVPNLLGDLGEVDRLRQDANIPHLTNPGFRATPLSEYNKTQPLLSLAFPLLFPSGKAEFVTSRLRECKYADYVEHLLKYHDSRFASHPRFRYVVFNTYMRAQVTKKSAYFVHQSKSELEHDIEALKAAFVAPDNPEAQKLLSAIIRSSAVLRGTRPFWNGKRSNLETYVRSIRTPNVFATFSAAELHWDSLHLCYGEEIYTAWKQGTAAQRSKISRDFLRDNPHKAAYHFHRRFNALMDTVITPKFGLTDYWNRYEFQTRSSSHSHGFLWLKDFVEWQISDINDEEQRQKFADYWGTHISGLLPINVRRERDFEERTMMSISPAEETNTLLQLATLVNAVQRHKCNSYCLRTKKGTLADSDKFCRFWFLWRQQDQPSVDKNKNPAHWMFSAENNDSFLNSYQRLVTMTWKANTDFTPCTNAHAVLSYLAKYCTKEEKKSTTYLQLVNEVIPYLSSAKPLLSMVAKVMNQLIGERD